MKCFRHLIPAIALMPIACTFLFGECNADTLIGMDPGSSDTKILLIQTNPFAVVALGHVPVAALSGLDVQPSTGILYASGGFAGGGADRGSIYTLNPGTLAVTTIMRSGHDAVPGLAADLDGSLYGSAVFTVSSSGAADRLIRIDQVNNHVFSLGTYGTAGGRTIKGIDDIDFNPSTGVLYGSSGDAFEYGDIFTIDKTTGAAKLVGPLTEEGSGNKLSATLAGLSFSPTGSLFGSLGGRDGRIISINLPDLTFKYLGTAAPGESISDIAVLSALGTTQKDPILPNFESISDGARTFKFTNVPGGRWYDPPATYGYHFSITSPESLFSDIVDFPTGFSDPFAVSTGGIFLGAFAAGQKVSFTNFLGGGVPEFTVTGINPMATGGNPFAFPLELDFTTPTASFQMQPLETPEPASFLLVLAVLVLLACRWKRQ